VLVRTKGGLVQENNVRLHCKLTKAMIKIPIEIKLHLVVYIALQLEKMDNKHFQNVLDAY